MHASPCIAALKHNNTKSYLRLSALVKYTRAYYLLASSLSGSVENSGPVRCEVIDKCAHLSRRDSPSVEE